MNKILNTLLVLPLVGTLLFAGCGGGDVFSIAEGGIGGTGISTGTVTGIGSITVNGVTFDTDSAEIYVEGVRVDDPADPTDGTGAFLLAEGFSEGQVVRVVGTFNADGKTGTADAVYYNDSIEGPVESVTPVDAATQASATVLRLVVMGQTVIVDSQTIIDGVTLASIDVDDLVEISGLVDEQGQIQAGYLELKGDFSAGGNVEIKGVIDAGSFNPNNFRINGLLVDFSLVTPVPNLQEGMQVEVKGTYNGTHIIAISIEQDDDIGGNDEDEVEYEGIVTDASAYLGKGDSFILGIQAVQTNAGTVYKGGLDTDVAAGVRLEVEGYLQGSTLIADEVRFRDEIEIDAPVASHSSTPETITITLNLGLDNIDVVVNELSELKDDAEGLTLSELDALLSNDDYVEVRGRLLNGSVIFAEEIKVDDDVIKTDVKVQGPVEDDPVVDPLVTILSIAINVDSHGITEFEDANDLPISRMDFFNTVVTGNIVSAEGALVSGVIDWDKLEIED